MLKSFLRYVGGKSKAVNTILGYIPKDINEYREPMVGSGIVMLSLLQTRKRINKIQVGDFDYDVYNVWNNVVYNTDELAEKCKDIIASIKKGEECIYNLSSFSSSGVDAAAIYLILNICKLYGNYGDIDKFYDSRLIDFDKKLNYRLYSVSNLVGNINIRWEDYEWALKEDGDNVCVFLDPPYYNVYAEKGYYLGHKEFNYDRLTKLLLDTKHRFIMTIDISDYSDSLKKYFNVEEYEIYYVLGRKWVNEVIVTNFK